MRRRVLEGELGRELAVDSTGEVNSGLYSVDRTRVIANGYTDLSPAFETRNSISPAFSSIGGIFALSVSCE